MAPKNGHGNPSAGSPTNTGAGTGKGSRGASAGRAAISRSTPGMASCRRGKRNTHRSSTSQTVLSQPSPISLSESSATFRELGGDQMPGELRVDRDLG